MFQKFLLAPLAALALLAATSLTAKAQTGGVRVGTAGTPDASAALDVSSTSKGLLPPRLTTAQRDAIAGPAAGLTIYNTTTGKLNTWNGTSWDTALSATEPAGTFAYTGGPQTYTVPAGIFRLRVDAQGGAGGASNNSAYGDPSFAGGGGARVRATLAVVPGQVLTLYVGGSGSTAPLNNNGQPGGGGYNGGGNAGQDGAVTAGGGGGASDVRTGSATLADRLLVAAGGGGGGYPYNSGTSALGGAGGAPTGGTGANGGAGATPTGGNALGQGGSATGTYDLQAGGGGGYYGGQATTTYGGGGGGSSFVTATGSSAVTMTAGTNAGNGVIVLTFDLPTAAPVLDGSNFVNVAGDNLGNHTATQNLNLADKLLVGNGGSAGLAISSAGKVGIGTPTPGQKLDVAGNANVTGNIVGGRVGIGTTAPPVEKLEIKDGSIQLTTTGPAAVGIRNASGSLNLGLTTNTGEYSNLALPGDAVLRTNGQRLILAGREGGTVLVTTGAPGAEAERLRVTTAGNVGIGAPIPTQKLEVAGQIFSSTGGFRFPDNTTQTTAGLTPGSAILNQTTLQSGAGFNIGGNGYVGGNVGIGTTAPLSRLSIQQVTSQGNTAGQNLGELSFVGFNRTFPSASVQALTKDVDNTGHLLFKTSPGSTGAVERLRIEADGNVGIGTPTPAASALLDVSSTTKGFLPPRLTTAQRDAIGSPATGLVLYNATTNKLNTWNGTAWDATITEQPYQGPAANFAYTGQPQTYTVPADVYTVRVDAYGASGGSSSPNDGGAGARVQATLTVVPGQVLTLYVGAAGGYGGAGTGGYNGGGDALQVGGGGGGASDVRSLGGTLADRLLVAGGGGGGAYTIFGSRGGNGGAPNGDNGNFNNFGYGTGASQAGGGNSGGSLGQGGAGSNATGSPFGGGGGGGYSGGGGGSAGAGGGGSSWVTPTGSSGISMVGQGRAGNGSITLTPGPVYTAPLLSGANFINVPGTWSVSGADVYRASGRVGIGTSSPGATLDVQGASSTVKLGGLAGTGTRLVTTAADGTLGAGSFPQLSISNSTISLTNGGSVTVPGDNLGNHTATTNVGLNGNWLSNAPGNANGLRVDNAGSVGVGVSSPTQALDVQGGILARSNSAISVQGAYLQWNRSGGDGETWLLNQQGGGSGGIRFGGASTANGALEWARFDGFGNLGLGTGGANPSQKLDVRGNVRLGNDGGNATGTGQTVEFVGPGFNTDPVGLYRTNPAADQSELRVVVGDGADANDRFVVGRSAATAEGGLATSTFTPSFTVRGNGSVGIGTSAPAAGLHVDAAESGSSTALGVLLGGGTSGNPSIELRGNGNTPYLDFAETSGVDYTTRLISQSGVLNVAGSGSGGVLLQVNGGLRATSYANISDARFKANVRPIGSALAAVLALRGVRYTWNALGVQHGGTAGQAQVGLLAQEVEKIYPELVSTGADGYKSVNYAQLTPVLIEALKEQQAQLEALKQQNAAANTRAAAAEAQATQAATKAAAAKAQAAQAEATTDAFEARLRALETGVGQARR